MTICFISAQYLPTVGGVERYTYNLAKQVTAAGHRAIVVTSALPGLPEHETDPDGIEVFRFPAWLFMNGRFPVPKPGAALKKALAPVWESKIDLCLINTRFYVSSLYAARECKKRKIHAIVVDHSTGHLPMGNALLNAAGAFYEHLAANYLRRCPVKFYGVSQAVCRWLSHFGIQAQGTLYNAVEPDAVRALADAPDKTDWRTKLHLSPDTRLIVSLGRLIPEKGVPQLIEAFQLAKPEKAALLVAGDGPLLAQLQNNCPDGVYLLGSTPYAQAMQLLRQAQLYCLPTYYAEGFPTTFLEAAACGCPILTTRTGGSDELLPDESCGIQLESPDPQNLAAALSAALENEVWRTQAAEKTAKRLEENFTWAAVSRHLLEIAQDT